MSIKGISLHEQKDFSMPSDKDKPTVWKIGVLDSRIRAKIDDESTIFSVSPDNIGDANTQLKVATKNLEIVRFGLRGFDNFLDEKGKPIKFTTETVNMFGGSYVVISKSLLKIIPSTVISALALEIGKENILSEKEIKNSA